MKRTLSFLLSVLLLLSLTACGKSEVPSEKKPAKKDKKYEQAIVQLKKGNWEEAYALLKEATDPRAAEELEHFVFVPVRSYREESASGYKADSTYAYDTAGHLIDEKKAGRSNWTTSLEFHSAYTYEGDKQVARTYRSQDYSFNEAYTYDAAGRELFYRFMDEDGVTRYGHTCTYDERGNLLEQVRFDALDKAGSITTTYTYDQENRVLTQTETDWDGDTDVYTYCYAEDGSYYYSHEGERYHQTVYFDKEGRSLGYKTFRADGSFYESEERRYDEDGHEIYCRTIYGDDYDHITMHIYNGQGLLVKTETLDNGELSDLATYTYNEAGKELTYDYFGDTRWGRTTSTYDEQGHLLARAEKGEWGWKNTTCTYDKTGNCVKKEIQSYIDTTTAEYAYDAWGNLTEYRSYTAASDGGDTATVVSAQWELRYYPGEVPDNVLRVIQNTQSEME